MTPANFVRLLLGAGLVNRRSLEVFFVFVLFVWMEKPLSAVAKNNTAGAVRDEPKR